MDESLNTLESLLVSEPIARDVTHLSGVPIDRLTEASFLTRIEQFLTHGGSRLVLYVNAACINYAHTDRRYAKILEEADLVCADGMGVVWASRLTGAPLPERVNVGEMIAPVCEMAAQHGARVFLLGGAPGIAQEAAARLTEQYASLQIVGVRDGYFHASEAQDVIDHIKHARPDLLLVGMGVPKQEKWLWRWREQLHVPVLWGVGAGLDYLAGRVPRAPAWMRRVGLEWSFRLLVEPKRLWRRYLIGNVLFIARTCALVLTDASVVALAWLGAYGIRHQLDDVFGFSINPIEPYLMLVPLIIGIWVVICVALGLYRRSQTMTLTEELIQVAGATCLGLLITIAVAFLLKELSVGRSVILLMGIAMGWLLAASRLTVRAMERWTARRCALRQALIVGTGSLAKRLKEDIELWPMGYEVVGFVSDGDPARMVASDEIVGVLNELDQLIRQRTIQDVFVASQHLPLHQELDLLSHHSEWPVSFHVVSEELESVAQRLPLERVMDELPLLHLPPARSQWWYEGTRRVLDLIVAVIGLLIGLPLCGVIALWIKLESPGPAIFTQQRVGKDGRLFSMYKFRTMKAGTPEYAVAPNELHDPRVTSVGRVLRRWSLDELPQLINVLTGDMTLIGPRPEMPFLVTQYARWQRWRLLVKPGLTGLWQVVGRKELPLHDNIEYDLYYVRHRGWWLDAAILLRTIPALLFRRGAF